MSLSVGSVTIDQNGNASGSGLSFAMYNALVASQGSTIAILPKSSKITFLNSNAQMATALANGVVPYLISNGVTVLTVGSGNVAGHSVAGPATSTNLPLT